MYKKSIVAILLVVSLLSIIVAPFDAVALTIDGDNQWGGKINSRVWLAA